MGHTNIEIKARCSHLEYIRELLEFRNARFQGLDHQIDTYFRVNHGRLKLREGTIENYLIHYRREDKEGPKQSQVILFKSDPNSSLKEILTTALGVLVIVDKKREIYWIDNVKFHLDTVQDLGNFVEIEAIDYNGTIGKDNLLQQCQQYSDLFNISQMDLVSRSYSDLLIGK
ncbi:class IV adenylate cyclase [Candidatus Woesearchaeota archaeon]|nr:class IV adenylate cyclase [Candidatus Woesearchaeota archaeon]